MTGTKVHPQPQLSTFSKQANLLSKPLGKPKAPKVFNKTITTEFDLKSVELSGKFIMSPKVMSSPMAKVKSFKVVTPTQIKKIDESF